MQLEESYAAEITKLVECVERKEEQLIQIVRTHQHISSAVLQTARCLNTQIQRGARQMKNNITEKTKERWRWKGEEGVNGKYPRNLKEKLVENELSQR